MCWHCCSNLTQCELCYNFSCELCCEIAPVDLKIYNELNNLDKLDNNEDGDNSRVSDYIISIKFPHICIEKEVRDFEIKTEKRNYCVCKYCYDKHK